MEYTNIFPDPFRTEMVDRLLGEAKAYCEKHQLIFCDTHAYLVLEIIKKTMDYMDSSNPLRSGTLI